MEVFLGQRLPHHRERRIGKMRVRKFLVWTVVGLFVANVFALPRTLAAFGMRGGGGRPNKPAAE
jgi:hypothetical protein